MIITYIYTYIRKSTKIQKTVYSSFSISLFLTYSLSHSHSLSLALSLSLSLSLSIVTPTFSNSHNPLTSFMYLFTVYITLFQFITHIYQSLDPKMHFIPKEKSVKAYRYYSRFIVLQLFKC